MGARRFFVDGIFAVGDRVALAPSDARKAMLVLRLHDGDALEICDSAGRTFDASLAVDGARGFARLEREREAPPAPLLEIVLAQAIPKGQKMDLVVEKATELGVARIVPVVSERSLDDPGEAKLERWRRIARTAAQQSGRPDVPVVDAPTAWSALFAGAGKPGTLALVPWELAPPEPLRDVLPHALEGVTRVLVAIGPEGGFGDEEIALAERAGARPISLGRRILRTETAGLVVCGILRYAAGDV
jgi:16S rRNA (uracil1498-N3)-methyltransferase